MRMRAMNQLELLERSEGPSVRTRPGSGLEQSSADTGTDLNLRSARRRESWVTVDQANVVHASVRTLTDAKIGGRSPSELYQEYRRMSAPELPPIANTGGRNYVALTNSDEKALTKNQSSGSLGEKRGTNTQSPFSQRSSSPSVSAWIGHTSGNNSISRLPSNDQLSCFGSTSNVKLETLFEKRFGMTLDSPRTGTSVGGSYNSPRRKNANNRIDRMSIRESSINARRKKGIQMHRSESETQLIANSPLPMARRLPTRIGVSSTSSVNNSLMNLTRNSSDQRLKDRSKNFRNKELNGNKPSLTLNNNRLSKKSSQSGTVNGMRKYSSTYALNSLNQNSKEEIEPDVDDRTDDEEENDKRIIDWLIGAGEAEPPPDPEIHYSDEPPQTDTALHIVYTGD